jgi:uncharacterized membrane protein YfcA
LSAAQIFLVGMIFFAAHMVSAVTGFGANVLGLPLLTLVIGIAPGKQSLIALGSIMYLYMMIRWWRHVDQRELWTIILVTTVGLCLGMILYQRLPQRGSMLILAIFVILVGLRGLLNLAPQAQAPRWFSRVMLFLGGVVHGAFTTGGPLLTIYARQRLRNKSTFRATLAVMWLILACALMIGWTLQHDWHPQTPHTCLIGFPFLLAGIAAGEFLHHRTDEKRFAILVNLTLVVVGVILMAH